MSCLDQIYLLKTNSSVKRYKIANTSYSEFVKGKSLTTKLPQLELTIPRD